MIDLNCAAAGSGRDATTPRRVAAISLLVVAAGLPVAAYCQSSAEASWEAIKTCAGIKEDKARFTCYDAVVRGAGLLPSAAELHRDTFGLPGAAAAPAPAPKATTAPAAAAAGAPKAAAAGSVATPSPFSDTGIHAAAATPAKLDVVIDKVEESYDSKVTLTTTEGAVWTQVEGGALREQPLKGATMTITQAAFGGFMCKSSQYVSFRCRRVR